MLREPATRFDDATQKWTLLEEIAAPSRGYVLVVPNGFASDGASTPRATWSLGFAPFELGFLPAFCHDWLYEHGGHITIRTPAGDQLHQFTKDDADLFFLDLMEQVGIDIERRVAAYEAVRYAGQSSFQANAPAT